MKLQKADARAETVYCLDPGVLEGVRRFVKLVGWVGLLKGEVRLESFDPVLGYVSFDVCMKGENEAV